jgi:hypothetical protein
LSTRRIDAPMTSTFCKESLDDVRADHHHRRILAQISKKWKKAVPLLGKICKNKVPESDDKYQRAGTN